MEQAQSNAQAKLINSSGSKLKKWLLIWQDGAYI